MDIDGLAASYLVEKLLDARLARYTVIAAPAAGADFSIVVPAQTFWEIITFQAVLTTSAVVANRFPSLRARDTDNNQMWQFGSGGAQAASASARYTFAQGLGVNTTGGATQTALPTTPLLLPGGTKLETTTSNIDVGDQWAPGFLVVRELTPDRIAEQVRRLENDVAGLFGRLDFGSDDDR